MGFRSRLRAFFCIKPSLRIVSDRAEYSSTEKVSPCVPHQQPHKIPPNAAVQTGLHCHIACPICNNSQAIELWELACLNKLQVSGFIGIVFKRKYSVNITVKPGFWCEAIYNSDNLEVTDKLGGSNAFSQEGSFYEGKMLAEVLCEGCEKFGVGVREAVCEGLEGRELVRTLYYSKLDMLD